MSVGKIGPFDLDKDSWENYVDRLEQYFIANEVKPELKVATLITVVGNEAYELMVSLCTPAKPASKTYSELVTVVKGHLNPKPSMLAERFKFRQRIQRTGESLACYVKELKKLSKDCGFTADSLKENLRDQFVCGIANDNIREKIFTEEDTISFDRAYKLAVSMEAAETNAALVEGCVRNQTSDSKPSNIAESVHRVAVSGSSRDSRPAGSARTTGGTARGSSARVHRGASAGGSSGRREAGRGRAQGVYRNEQHGSGSPECAVCGGNHSAETCKFKMYLCRVCNRAGHLKKMCPQLRRAPVHYLEEKVGYESDDDVNSDEVNNYSLRISDCQSVRPYTIDICIEGVMINMEIDTGSAISCISLDCYEKFFGHCKLRDSNLILRYYTGESIKPIGKITPAVKYKTTCKQLDLYIIENGKTNLLGRSWLNKLEIKIPVFDCHKVNSCNESSFNIDKFSSRYCDVFADGLGRFTGGTVGFHLREGARPVFMRARPLAYALREPVERALDQMVRDGIITPVTTSDWATPIVPVMKKDGTIRVCADFKLTLNKCLEVDHYPLPKVEDLLTKLHGGEKFTKLDLSQAYAQFELDESKKFTVINTHKGLFMYNRLIYGLASSPGIFQRKLEQLFADMPRVGVFLDDLIITGVDDSSHLGTLHEVFERLKKYGLKIKKEKCTFFAESVSYLGFIISKQGVQTCPEKIKAINKAPTPTNVTELRSFLGLVMYYAKFVRNLSTLLAPLYTLLRKDVKFEWSEHCTRAFNKVKRVLVSSEILAHYSPDLPLVLTTDASGVGVGAVISHLMPGGEERPIAYASRVLNVAEKSYSQIEREALAIIYGVRKFHQYLYGRKFILRTDHKPLVSIFGDKTGIPVMAASRMQRWAVILAGYHYTIEYVRSENNAADALSRLPAVGENDRERTQTEVTYLNFIQNFLPITRKTVQNHVNKDNILRKVFLFLQSGWPNECNDEKLKPYFVRRNELYLDRDCIVWGYRLVIPEALRADLLKELHTGHLGIVKMKSMARSIMWWPGIDADIEGACRCCETCARESSAPPHAPPQPWPYVTEPWSRLHIDFLGPTHGKTFLILIDSTSKWIEAFEMQRTTAGAVIKVLRETFARFGLPKEIVSDNGPPFSSKEYADFMTKNGIRVTFSPVYHPASNGAAEAAVKLCKRAIKKSKRDNCDLDAALQTYLMMYRNVVHSTTGVSPAMLLLRRNLQTRLDLLRSDRQLDSRVNEVQQKQICSAGGILRDFNVGDKVWARDYAGGKWFGGQVEHKLGSRSYVIGKEGGPSVKRHVDQLRKKRCSYSVPSSEPETTLPGVTEFMNDSVSHPAQLQTDESQTNIERPGSFDQQVTAGSPVIITEAPEQSAQEPAVQEIVSADVSPGAREKRVRKPVKRLGFDLEFD